MGEQRSRRPCSKAPVDLIDSAGSRGLCATPLTKQTRKFIPERYPKLDCRREDKSKLRRSRRSVNKHSLSTSCNLSVSLEEETPRVNPIFVFVRQVDSQIVDVKCEDYDKRNRIVLTKTSKGWRAIPRRETHVPSLKKADKQEQHTKSSLSKHHYHRRHKSRKRHKSKCHKKSTYVQVDEETKVSESEQNAEEDNDTNLVRQMTASPDWLAPVNVESLLPSHTIHVFRRRSVSPQTAVSECNNITNINNAEIEMAYTQTKLSESSPLENLLAVAELELNYQKQTDELKKAGKVVSKEIEIREETKHFDIIEHTEYLDKIHQLNTLIESCPEVTNMDGSQLPDKVNSLVQSCPENNLISTTESCQKETENNNLSNKLPCMEQNKDLKLKLEIDQQQNNLSDIIQSCIEATVNDQTQDTFNEKENEYKKNIIHDFISNIESTLCQSLIKAANTARESLTQDRTKCIDESSVTNKLNDVSKVNFNSVNEFFEKENEFTEGKMEVHEDKLNRTEVEVIKKSNTENSDLKEQMLIPLSNDELPKNLSVKLAIDVSDSLYDEPTDLTLPKYAAIKPTTFSRSSSMQSPQPSGLPAFSPDIVTSSKSKGVFLDFNNSPKISFNSEEIINTSQTEPLDLGKCRKSASPTITCSEEVESQISAKEYTEPLNKKRKPEDIILKRVLQPESAPSTPKVAKISLPENSRLLELLQKDSGPNPLTQFRQVIKDSAIDVPDPMLIPKKRLSNLISHPGREIPKLLKQRPELRLPEALSLPHLLHDPDILVITLDQLETIIRKQGQSHIIRDKSPEKQKDQEEEQEKVKEKEKINASVKSKKPHIEMCKTTSYPNIHKRKADILSAPVEKSIIGNSNKVGNDINGSGFNDMMWLPYMNQIDTFPMANNPYMTKLLASFRPVHHSQVTDLPTLFNNSYYNKFQVPILPLQSPINFRNPIEMQMWQEAIMQFNMLRPNDQFESQYNANNNYYLEKHSPSSNMHHKTATSNNLFLANNGPNLQYQNSRKHNTSDSSQFSPLLVQKNISSLMKPNGICGQIPTHRTANRLHFSNDYSQITYEKVQPHQQERRFELGQQQKAKINGRSFINAQHYKEKPSNTEINKQTGHAIDLSRLVPSKQQVKLHSNDTTNSTILEKYEDVPEVGSTTTSIEEMHDESIHLWHPLFGK